MTQSFRHSFLILLLVLSGTMGLAQDYLFLDHLRLKKHPQDPDTPRIVIQTAGQKFQFGIGGFARLNGVFDLNGLQDMNDFIVYEIPVGPENNYQERLSLGASQSRLFTELLGKTKYGPVRVYFEADFYGNNNTFRLRHAYGQFKGFLFGQTWSTFMDLDASPNTIDFEGPNSEIAIRNPMIRYGRNIGKKLYFAVAAETPEASITVGPSTESIPQFMPDIIGRFGIRGKWGHLQIASVRRVIAYEDSLNGDIEKLGWGSAFSGSFNITGNDIFMFQALYGKGIARYIQDISGYGLDLVPKSPDSSLSALPVYGGYAAFQHNWTQTLNSTLVYSLTYTDDLGLKPDDAYQIGQYVAINLFWDVLPVFTLGIEYLWGQRENKDGAKGTANRFDLMAQFSF